MSLTKRKKYRQVAKKGGRDAGEMTPLYYGLIALGQKGFSGGGNRRRRKQKREKYYIGGKGGKS